MNGNAELRRKGRVDGMNRVIAHGLTILVSSNLLSTVRAVEFCPDPAREFAVGSKLRRLFMQGPWQEPCRNNWQPAFPSLVTSSRLFTRIRVPLFCGFPEWALARKDRRDPGGVFSNPPNPLLESIIK